MNKEKTNRVLEALDTLYPDAWCELNHRNELELLIAVMLSAQTTDKNVNRVTPSLFEHYPTVQDYAQADLHDLENHIRSIGLYRNKAKNLKAMAIKLIEDFGGEVPKTKKELETLPGVGHKTANVVVSVAYHEPALAVDTHVERIAKRLGFAKKEDSVLVVEKKLMRSIPKDRWIKSHHQLIFFGRYFCKATHPNCQECQLYDLCKDKEKKEKYRHEKNDL